VNIAAIISASDATGDLAVAPEQFLTTGSIGVDVRAEILGKSLLDRTVEKLDRFGVSHHTVVSSENIGQREEAVAAYLRNGIDALFLLQLNAYTDLDFAELLKRHLEGQSPVTQASADDGLLDISLVQASAFRTADGAYRRALSTLTFPHDLFHYRGYVNRLMGPQDLFLLVEDGLRGRCGLQPIGNETRSRVWQGTDSEIDDSAMIAGPAFVGAGAHVAAGCTIAPGSAIERDCEIDCGTSVQESWIQQNTYVGVALDVRRSIVSGETLFHIDRNVKLNIGDSHFIGATAKSASLLSGLGSLLWGDGRAL